MKILNEKDLEKLIIPEKILEAVEQATLSLEDDNYSMPDRLHLSPNQTTHLAMLGANNDYFVSKTISISKRKDGTAITNGALLLNSGSTGQALALMNTEMITKHRTGALAAVAAKYLHEEKDVKIGIVGAGKIGFHMAQYVALVKNVCKFYIFDPNMNQAVHLIEKLSKLYPKAQGVVCNDINDVVSFADVILMATTSNTPVLPDDELLLTGKTYIAIGSYKPNMKELPNALFKSIKHCFIDVDFAIKESGDLIEPIVNSLFHIDNIHRLGAYMKNPKDFYLGKTRLFKGVGHALLDLATASVIYEKSIEKNIGKNIDL